MALLGAHLLLVPQFMAVNGRMPVDLLMLRFEYVVQLSVMLLALMVLTGAGLVVDMAVQRLPKAAAGWAWVMVGAVLVSLTLRQCLMWFAPPDSYLQIHILSRDFGNLSIPLVAVLSAALLGLDRAQVVIPRACVMALFVVAGLWLPMLVSAATWQSRHAPGPSVRPRIASGPTVWVHLFDELDAGIALDGRASPRLRQEFEQWQKDCFFAPNAMAAGTDTLTSVTSMLRGKLILKSKAFDSRSILITDRALARSKWQGEDSLFRAWANQGGAVRIFGWYFPYEAWFGGRYETVVQYPAHIGYWADRLHAPFPKRVWAAVVECFVPARNHDGWLNALVVPSESARADISLRIARLQQAEHQGLNWIHWPIPHFPGLRGDPKHGYGANLDLVADELHRFREQQIRTGAWERDVVIVMADHGLRTHKELPDFLEVDQGRELLNGGHRVPFLCRLPGMRRGRAFSGALPLVGIQRLLLGIQSGQIATYDDLTAWADAELARSAGAP